MAIKRKITESFEDENENKVIKTNTTTTTTTSTASTSTDTTTTTNTSSSSSSKEQILNILTNEKIKELNIEEMKEWFKEVAYQLLNNTILMINGKEHVLVEIEFYFNGYKHIDHFAHGDEMQYEKGTWYFHRVNGTGYKSGSFKGLDITFGINKEAYGGILIRSIQDCTNSTIIDGPSLCVDHILKTTNSTSIIDFINNKNPTRSIFENENSMLYFKMRDEFKSKKELELLPPVVKKNDILACARVGLTFKRYKKTQEYFIAGEYRFIRLPNKVKKGKHYMTVALLLQGNDSVSIKNQIGSTQAAVEKVRTQVKLGESLTRKNISDFTGELSTDELCKLLSLCNKLTKEKNANADEKNDEDDEDNDDTSVDQAATSKDNNQDDEEADE